MMKNQSSWRSPSNIALIKYWGKYGVQLPCNSSISFTLENAFTETTLSWTQKTSLTDKIEMNFLFEGEPSEKFAQKIEKFLDSIKNYFPFLSEYDLQINSHNSFPHSTGIASSASSMSALALCLCSMENILTGNLSNANEFYRKASIIARLGSGSACRSVYPTLAIWGKHAEIDGSSQEYAIPFSENVDLVFKTFRDAILIVSSEEKSVSSRAGHALMESNPFANTRFQQANDHLVSLISSMHNGDLNTFGSIVEKEALTLHALMMTSEPSYILMKPNTLHIVDKVREWRKETGLPLYFTLDAGPNVHLLYPEEIEAKAETFIREILLQYCDGQNWIRDKVGKGPQRLA